MINGHARCVMYLKGIGFVIRSNALIVEKIETLDNILYIALLSIHLSIQLKTVYRITMFILIKTFYLTEELRNAY